MNSGRRILAILMALILVLALSATAYIVSVDPRTVSDDAAFADAVAPILQADRELMLRLASQADLKKLADTGCHWKPQNPDQCIVHTLVSSCGMDPAYEDNTADFHPDGGSGCILSNDDYVFGIRCNHLIWMTGNHDTDGPGVLLVGNHKGALTMAILRDASFHY